VAVPTAGIHKTRPGRPVAPWVRTRLRAGPAGALALAVLVAVTAFLAAALPRSVDGYENDALRRALARIDLGQRSVNVTADVSGTAEGAAAGGAAAVPGPAQLSAVDRVFDDVVRPPLAPQPGQAEYGLRSFTAVPVPDPAVARLDPRVPSRAVLLTQQQSIASQARLTAGRLPQPRPDGRVEAVVTTGTARTMHLRAGSTLHLTNAKGPGVTVRVTGIVRPLRPGAPYWHAEPDVPAPGRYTIPSQTEPPKPYWQFTLLIDPGAAGAMLRLDGAAQAFWHHPLDTGALTARDVPGLRRELAALSNGSSLTRMQERSPVPGLAVEADGLKATLTSFAEERDAAGPLVLIAAVGVGAVAVVVLLMAGGLAAARRRPELELLRARGAGLAGLTVRLLGETTAVAVPAAAAGTLLALVLVPSGRTAPAVLLGAATAAAASLALPLRAAAAHRRPRLSGREDVTAVRPSRRRTVAELTLFAVVAGALAALRHRGTSGGVDVLTAAVPVLLAVGAALVLLRLYPVPLRLLARPAARLNGAVAHLGLARAGRAPAAAALPLLAVLTALTVASFGGSVLAGVDAGRAHAATVAVGADARVDAVASLPHGLAARVRRIRGVREVTAVRVEPDLGAEGADLATDSFAMVAVDPAAYARLTARTGLDRDGALPVAALGRGGRGPLPAVVSPGLARFFGRAGTASFDADCGRVGIRVVAVRDRTPATSGDFVVVSAAALRRTHPGYQASGSLDPTTLLVTGPHVDGGELHTVAHRASPTLAVAVRSEELARYTTSPLQSGARRVYVTAVAAGAGYSALALLLSLLQTAPQRRAVLARLRTMGMTRRQSHALVLLETLPQALTGVVGGALVALAAVPLLRPDVDLTALAFAAAHDPDADTAGAVLRTDPASLLVPSAALLVLACAVLGVQTWLGSRRGEGMDLRMGDRA
jgi:putative ABC transport system permease protein